VPPHIVKTPGIFSSNADNNKEVNEQEKQSYINFVKNAWTQAINHKKGTGEISQDDYVILPANGGYVHTTNAQRVKHIYDSHGNTAIEAEQGQIAIKAEDFLIVPEIIENPTFIMKNVKYKDTYNTLYAKQTTTGNTYIYIEKVSKKKKRCQQATFFNLNRIAESDDILKIMKNNAFYDLSEIKIENPARGGGQPSGDGSYHAANAAATSAIPADTLLSHNTAEKSSFLGINS
jgi:hypothetical protein